MKRFRGRVFRLVILAELCLALCCGMTPTSALAQRRPPASRPPETPSQRWLPLPQGGQTDFRRQVQWLQQMKGLLGSENNDRSSSAVPKFDPEQLKALMESLRQLGGTGTDGDASSVLDGISPDVISKAMSDPVLREQARRMLEQFSRDGEMPPSGEGSNSTDVPIPGSIPPRSNGPGETTSRDDASHSQPTVDPTTLPPAMQKLLLRLAEQAARQSDASKDGTATEPNGLPSPNRNTVSSSNTNGLPNGTRSTNELPRPGERTKADGTRSVPAVGTGPSSGREDIAAPNSAAHAETGPANRDRRLNNLPSNSDSANIPPGTVGPNGRQPAGATDPKLPSSGNRSATDSTNQRTPQGIGSDQRDTRETTALRERKDSNEGGLSQATTSPESNGGPSGGNADSSSGPKRPTMDVRSELQERGFAQTLRKLVEQARDDAMVEEDLAAGSQPESSNNENDGPSAGLNRSLNQILDGVQRDMVAAAQEGSQMIADGSAGPHSSPASSATTSPPVPSTFGEKARNLLTDLVTAPGSGTPSTASVKTSSTKDAADSNRGNSRSTIGLLVLLGVMGLIWYCVPQVVAAVHRSRLAAESLGPGGQPLAIRSRADVVRAFHNYALRPIAPNPDWWTHRDVERRVADEAPSLRPSIQTLSDLYEQARYLPEEAELTIEQLESARRALDHVQADRRLR